MKAPKEEISRYGIVRPKVWDDGRFEIDLLVEKPKPGEAPSDYGIAGRYAFVPEIFDYIRKTKPGSGGELQITDSIALMLADCRPVWCVPLVGDEVRRDIGTFESYFEAFNLAATQW
jgi:UTP--glucose-1-phosphate uridylyltransferase